MQCQKGCAGKCAADGSCPGRCRPGYGKVGRNCRQVIRPPAACQATVGQRMCWTGASLPQPDIDLTSAAHHPPSRPPLLRMQCTKPNCENCDGSKGICRRCEALGYGLVGGACRLCAVENCDLCVDGNLKACQTCAFGFYLTPGRKCERVSGAAGALPGGAWPPAWGGHHWPAPPALRGARHVAGT